MFGERDKEKEGLEHDLQGGTDPSTLEVGRITLCNHPILHIGELRPREEK